MGLTQVHMLNDLPVKSVGTKIQWKDGKNLAVQTIQKVGLGSRRPRRTRRPTRSAR